MSTTYQQDLFAGKTALVAGATQGIGAVIANQLAAMGARVVALGLGQGDGTLAQTVEVREADVTKQDDLDRVLADLPTLDIVFNCAGIIKRGEEHDVEVFQRVLEVNLTGTMRVCSAVRSRLKATRGCIVNTASMLTFFGGGLCPAMRPARAALAS